MINGLLENDKFLGKYLHKLKLGLIREDDED
jgi:hypothetical protein